MIDAAAGLTAEGEHLRAPWRLAEWLMLIAGWGAALATLLPAAAAADASPARLALGATLLFWPLAVAVVRFDVLHYVIPDEATAGIAALGLLAAAGGPWAAGEGGGEAAGAALGAAATGAGAFALFWAVGGGFRLLGRDALGFGDVKLAGACAVWLPPADAALALEVAAFGAAAMLVLARRGAPLRDTAVPFGAFMAPAAWLVVTFVPPLRDAGAFPW